MQTSLTDTALAMQLMFVGLILLYGTVLVKVVPRKHHVWLNVSVALAAILLGLLSGLSFAEMGLGTNGILKSVEVAGLFVLALTGVLYIVSRIAPLRKFFLGGYFARVPRKKLFYEAGFRVPLGTALLEEVLFRGVLLGMLYIHYSAIQAVIYSAIVFGLWHIFPTVADIEQNEAAAQMVSSSRKRRWGSVALVVFSTSVAGMFFSIVRLWAGSLLAPWLIHWAINSSSIITAAILGKRHHKGRT